MAKHFICDNCLYTFTQEEAFKPSAGKAVLGALIAGPAGAVVGAAMGKKDNSTPVCPKCGSYRVNRL